jgi:hypothetical protein
VDKLSAVITFASFVKVWEHSGKHIQKAAVSLVPKRFAVIKEWTTARGQRHQRSQLGDAVELLHPCPAYRFRQMREDGIAHHVIKHPCPHGSWRKRLRDVEILAIESLSADIDKLAHHIHTVDSGQRQFAQKEPCDTAPTQAEVQQAHLAFYWVAQLCKCLDAVLVETKRFIQSIGTRLARGIGLNRVTRRRRQLLAVHQHRRALVAFADGIEPFILTDHYISPFLD